MNRSLLVLLSGLSFALPACSAAPSDEADSESGALTAAATDYLETGEYRLLSNAVQAQVRLAVATSAPAEARTAMIALFRSPAFMAVGRRRTPSVAFGENAQLAIAYWARANAATAATHRMMLDVLSLGPATRQAEVKAVVAKIAANIKASGGVYAGQPEGGGAGTGGAESGGAQGTNGGGGAGGVGTGGGGGGRGGGTGGGGGEGSGGTSGSLVRPESADEAGRALKAMFSKLDVQAPSRSLHNEWTTLKARYQRGLVKAAANPEVRTALQEARHFGSETLAGDDAVRAARQFDQASLMVDNFVRGRIGFSVGAMNAVHSVVATEHALRGQVRIAGQNVFRGRDVDKLYLPGSEVAPAVATLFAEVHTRDLQGRAAPELAAMFDQRMISIHPYLNANGRTTRLMTDWLLTRDGFPPVVSSEGTPSGAVFVQNGALERDAHTARITEGMRQTVALLEEVA